VPSEAEKIRQAAHVALDPERHPDERGMAFGTLTPYCFGPKVSLVLKMLGEAGGREGAAKNPQQQALFRESLVEVANTKVVEPHLAFV
jgi:hypothetical protein